jgi:carboxylate-amine ligase
MNHALGLAALIQALTRLLWRLRVRNQRWRRYDNFLVQENRWRAQRYGTSDGLIDFGRGEIVPFAELFEELLELVEEDAGVLQCAQEIEALREIMETGTSAERQRAAAQGAKAAGADTEEQMRAVVRHLIEEFSTDL